MTELTPRQERILEAIRQFTADHGYPPSTRQIGTSVGLRSSSSVHAQLNALRRKDYLTFEPGQPRTLRVNA